MTSYDSSCDMGDRYGKRRPDEGWVPEVFILIYVT